MSGVPTRPIPVDRNITLRPDLSGSLNIAKPDWETYCHKVADLIVQEQSPERVMQVRAKFYELLSHCIPPTIILKVGFFYVENWGTSNCSVSRPLQIEWWSV